jgi:hypothetical protein
VIALQVVPVRLQLPYFSVTACYVYIPPSVPIVAVDMTGLVSQVSLQFMLLGSFNEKYVVLTDDRGRVVAGDVPVWISFC